MKKYLFIFLLGIGSFILIAATYQIPHKGNGFEGKKVIVSSTTATVIIDSTVVTTTDFLIKNWSGNIAGYDIFIDSHSSVAVSGNNEGYRLEVGESISPAGKVYEGGLWGKALTADTTIYLFYTTEQ